MCNDKKTENYVQIQYWSEGQDIEGMFFFIGATVQNLKDIHPQFVVKIIPNSNFKTNWTGYAHCVYLDGIKYLLVP